MTRATVIDDPSRFTRVLDFIDRHAADDLDLETLSDVASSSKYHFHRRFSALFGVTAFRYVQAVRLKRAAYRLAFRDDSVIEVALASGYEGPEAFSRAFKKLVGHAPSVIRRRPELALRRGVYEPVGMARRRLMTREADGHQVRIVDFPETRVATLEHRGDPALIGASIRKFIEWRRREKLPPRLSDTFNILYGDPAETPPEQFRLDLCAATDRELAQNGEGVVARVIPSGRCAMLRHVGPEEGFIAALRYLCAEWLPQSGEQQREFPLFCRRVSFFPDVPEHEAVTEIFLPLE
ncbi:MAG: AraC family transcriptional regulator [Isosphaeraceae bacterium]